MKRLSSVSDILDFAIAAEIKAHERYMEMAIQAENGWIRSALEGLAEEERQHRLKLEAVKAGKTALKYGEVGDLRIAGMLDEVVPNSDMDYRELLVFAMKREDISYKLYTRLASIFSEPELSGLFLSLAEQEADHKRRFEMQYKWLGAPGNEGRNH